MGFSLFPKNIKFFEYFQRQQKLVAQAADVLLSLSSGAGAAVDHCGRLHTIEAEGNLLVREISRLLAETFITPIDREDVYRIANGYEELLNQIRAIGVRIGLYRAGKNNVTTRELADDFKSMIANCAILLDGIAADTYSEAPMNDIIRLKTESDNMLLVAMGELQERAPAGETLSEAQILDRCETLLVTAERFAYTLEAIGIKNV
ncbi:MAG: DUF47 family protein [Elusimicrobiota bacterium]